MRAQWGLAVVVASLAIGCGEEQTVCERAADKLEECEAGRVEAQGYMRLPLVISTDDCSGDNECLAKCVAPATCAEIVHGLKGGSTDPNEPPVSSALIGCVYACIE
jgi:hypothetical protein